ncbi:CBS domain-containing protein [Dactylosporangium roseum]|uniref:CBS domain-containing protein n=1 Tax=Dactylosporangium roseum TaxID=47989 RepID=A0ABY5YWN2_9ACTN|nr:CBS domain-containing protein [Dactylosporangium roseum]UWZ34163.1 CBS domain-containing protein [Dactylosporangium roseum]
MSDLFVRDVMTAAVLVATPECRYQQIVDVLTGYDVSGLPVVDDDDHVIGMVSEADVLRPNGHATARELMTGPAVTVDAGAPVGDAVDLMERHHLKRLAVTDGPDGRLVGIVTRRDILRHTVRGEAPRCDMPDDVLVQHYVTGAGSR